MTALRPLLALLFALSLSACASGGGSAASAAPDRVTLVVGGAERSYTYRLPSQSSAAPVVLSFHGFGGSAAQQEQMSGLTPLAARAGMIMVYPEGRRSRSGGKQFWATQVGQDRDAEVAFVRAILDDLETHHAIDRSRVFVTGISNGGGMAHMLAARMGTEIAAIAPVSGAYYDHRADTPRRAVPILAFHGERDRIVPIDGRGRLPAISDWATYWAGVNGCTATPKVISQSPLVTRKQWSGCAAPVTLVTLRTGRHSWPGGRSPSPIEASAEIMAFFAAR